MRARTPARKAARFARTPGVVVEPAAEGGGCAAPAGHGDAEFPVAVLLRGHEREKRKKDDCDLHCCVVVVVGGFAGGEGDDGGIGPARTFGLYSSMGAQDRSCDTRRSSPYACIALPDARYTTTGRSCHWWRRESVVAASICVPGAGRRLIGRTEMRREAPVAKAGVRGVGASRACAIWTGYRHAHQLWTSTRARKWG